MNKKNILITIIALSILVESFSLIQGYFKIPDVIVMSSVILISFISYPHAFFNKSTLFFFIFAIIIILNLIAKDDFHDNWFFIILLYWFFILSILNVLLEIHVLKYYKFIAFLGLGVLLLTSIMTIPLAIINPMIVRNFAVSSNISDIESIKSGQQLGIISYGLVHAIPCIFPLLVYLYKKSKRKFVKTFWVITSIIIYYLILIASFGTVLILSTFIIPVSFLVSNNRYKNIVIFITIIMLIPILNTNYLIDTLDYIKPFFDNTVIYEKITDIESSLNYGESTGQIENRESLYSSSWNAFVESPFWGTNKFNEAGGHSFILDFMAWFGLIGVLPVILFYLHTLKRIFSTLHLNQRIYYVLSIIPFIILSFIKGTPFFEQLLFLFLIIPSLYISASSNIKLITDQHVQE